MSVDLVALFVTLEQYESTEENTTSIGDIIQEFPGVSETELFEALEKLADVKLVDALGRGLTAEWFIDVPDVNSDNAESVAESALKSVEPKPEPRKRRTAAEMAEAKRQERERTEYNAKAAESQDAVMSQGENVDYSDLAEDELPSAVLEILEEAPATPLDVAQAMAVHPATLVTVPKPFVSVEHESDIEKNGLALDEPEFIPELPEGVNGNTWYMAHAAITQTARDWWMGKAAEQRNAFILANPGTSITEQELAARL